RMARSSISSHSPLGRLRNSTASSAASGEWLDMLERAGVPAGPVNDVLQMQADPQTLARQMIVETPHTTLGSVKTIGLPVKFSATPGGPQRGAPLYGEHTAEVLREHGFSDAEIDRLAQDGAIRIARPAAVAAE
ncbi:MAG TPA: CoA transferase, partial [Xanthobacteraceae bacterium]|nr:CoA transferase [Xanthobacteraceae bacterium]